MQLNPAQPQPPQPPEQPAPQVNGVAQPVPQVNHVVPMLFPEPPSHYKESFNQSEVLTITDLRDYTKTFKMFGTNYNFQHYAEGESVKHLDQNSKVNLKKLTQGITGSMVGILKVFSKPNHTLEQINELFKDLEEYTKQFYSICRKIRVNEINIALTNRLKRDTVEIEKLTEKMEVSLKKLDQMYLFEEFENSAAKQGNNSQIEPRLDEDEIAAPESSA